MSAKKIIEAAAAKAVKLRLDGVLNSLSNQTPGSQRNFGCLNDDNTKIVFPDKTSAPVYVTGRPVSRCGPVTSMGDGTYHMEGRKVDVITIGGGSDAWFIMGVYPVDPDPFTNVVSTFPEFSLVNGTSLEQYWINPLFLSSLYHPHVTDNQGTNRPHDGAWQAQLSPDLKHIVITRIADHNTQYPFEVIGDLLTIGEADIESDTDEMTVYWAVISNFTLDSTLHEVVMTPGTVVINQGFKEFTEIPPVRDYIPQVFGFDSTVNYLFERANTGVSVVDFSSGIPVIDIVGSWQNSSYFTGDVHPWTFVTRGGAWSVKDLTGGATEVHGPDLGPIMSHYIPIQPYYPYRTERIVPFIGPVSVDKCFLDSRTNRTGTTLEYQAFRKGSITSSLGTVDTAPFISHNTLSNPNYNSILSTFSASDDVFIVDDTRTYPSFNAITGWQVGDTNRVKTTDTGTFLDLVTPDSNSKYAVQKWKYDAADNNVTKGAKVTTKAIDNTFSIFTSGGYRTNWRILDWILK